MMNYLPYVVLLSRQVYTNSHGYSPLGRAGLKIDGVLGNMCYMLFPVRNPATVAHPLVAGKVIGSNFGPTPSHN